LPSFQEKREVLPHAGHERRNYASIVFAPAINSLLIRVSSRYRAVVSIDAGDELRRVFNFETTLHPYGITPLASAGGMRLLVAFGEPVAPAHGFFAVIDRERSLYFPDLSRFDGDFPDVAYSDVQAEAAFVLLRRSAQIMKVRSTER
jgi:hypothetical protein